MTFWTYVLRCADGSYYAGHTDDLEAGIPAHSSGLVEGYTSSRLPVTLEWSQDFATREEAIAAERQIKGWSRAKKEALIRGDWEGIQYLGRKLFRKGSFDTAPEVPTQDERSKDPNSRTPFVLSSRASGVSKDVR